MAFAGAFIFLLCLFGFQLYVNPDRLKRVKETEVIMFLLVVVVVAAIGAEALVVFAKGIVR